MRCLRSSAVFIALVLIPAGVAQAQTASTPIRLATSLSATPPAFVIRPALIGPLAPSSATLRTLPAFPSPRLNAMAGEGAGPGCQRRVGDAEQHDGLFKHREW